MSRDKFGGEPVVVGDFRDDDDQQQVRVATDVVRLLNFRLFLQESNQGTELIGAITFEFNMGNDAKTRTQLINRDDGYLAIDDPGLPQLPQAAQNRRPRQANGRAECFGRSVRVALNQVEQLQIKFIQVGHPISTS